MIALYYGTDASVLEGKFPEFTGAGTTAVKDGML